MEPTQKEKAGASASCPPAGRDCLTLLNPMTFPPLAPPLLHSLAFSPPRGVIGKPAEAWLYWSTYISRVENEHFPHSRCESGWRCFKVLFCALFFWKKLVLLSVDVCDVTAAVTLLLRGAHAVDVALTCVPERLTWQEMPQSIYWWLRTAYCAPRWCSFILARLYIEMPPHRKNGLSRLWEALQSKNW